MLEICRRTNVRHWILRRFFRYDAALNRRSTFLAFALVALAFFSAAAFELPALERSVSVSRQFIVYSSDVRVRAALCSVAERTKATLLALLQTSDQWKIPIVINAMPAQANLPELPAAALTVSQTGFGLKLQLDLTIRPDLDATAIERELLRAVLLERIYRAQPNLPAGAAYVPPPEWLLDGVLAWGSQRDPTEFAAPLKTIVAANKIVSLQDFLRQQPETLDSPSREVYRCVRLRARLFTRSRPVHCEIYCRSG